jgi:hypothetical protein
MLVNAVQEYEEKLATWFKSLLGISSAALAVLVSLLPSQDVLGVAKYALITCWISLAVTILFTLLASYRSVHKASMELAAVSNLVFRNDSEILARGRKMIHRGKQLSPVLKFSQWMSVTGFASSFVSLAVFACAQTL